MNGLAATSRKIVSCGIDDSVRVIDQETKAYELGREVALGSQPRAVASVVSDGSGGGDGGVTVVAACVDQVAVVRDGRKIASVKIDYEGESVAVGPPDSGDVAVGGQDNKVWTSRQFEYLVLVTRTKALLALLPSPLESMRAHTQKVMYQCTSSPPIVKY